MLDAWGPSGSRPPLLPLDREAAVRKVRAAEDGWNSRDPQKVSLAYTPGSVWRNRDEFLVGRAGIVRFLTQEWPREHDYRLIKELWPSVRRPDDHAEPSELGF